MPVYKVDHETVYDYTLPVILSSHLAHMLPREVPQQQWLSHDIEIVPAPVVKQERVDIFGNRALAFSIESEHKHFKFKVSGEVLVEAKELPKSEITWEEVAKIVANPKSDADLEAAMYAFNSPLATFDESVKGYVLDSFTANRSLFEATRELTTRIYNDCIYSPGTTKIGALPPEILRERCGVCQDFAHLMIGCLRSLHLPCRYVSGYLVTHPPEGQPKLTGADATHAWVSTYFPDYGWVDFDPTNDILGGEEHITVAWGRDFSDVSPLKGVITGGGPHTLKVAVNVVEKEC